MAFLRQWLLGVVACATLVSAAGQICPEGALRKIARLTGGLLLLLAMLRPLGALRPAESLPDADGYREEVARLERELSAERENALRHGIASELEAYIEDKAGALGAEVRAEAELETRGGVPLPKRVTLRGAYSEALSAFLASELGIAKEKQIWIESN